MRENLEASINMIREAFQIGGKIKHYSVCAGLTIRKLK